MLTSPVIDDSGMSSIELAPLSIKCIDGVESAPSAGCARHGDDFAQQVLSDMLIETTQLLSMPARCCRLRARLLMVPTTRRLRSPPVGTLTMRNRSFQEAP